MQACLLWQHGMPRWHQSFGPFGTVAEDLAVAGTADVVWWDQTAAVAACTVVVAAYTVAAAACTVAAAACTAAVAACAVAAVECTAAVGACTVADVAAARGRRRVAAAVDRRHPLD